MCYILELQSHLRSEAKHLVSGLGYSGKNYAEALKELKRAFGHKIKVARAFLNTVTVGPPVAPRDAQALHRFYVALRDCVTTLQQLNYSSDLYSYDNVLKIANRIPLDKVARWNSYVRDASRVREPSLIDICDWLRDQVDAEFNPFAVSTESRCRVNIKPCDTKHNKRTNFNVSRRQEKRVQNDTRNQDVNTSHTQIIKCLLCTGNHAIYKCATFLNMSVDKRKQFISDKGLCLNCLKSNHRTDTCFSATRCRHQNCNEKHHSLIHSNITNETTQSAAVHTSKRKSNQNTAYLQIVSVSVHGKNGCIISTYALLDSASEISMIHEDLAKDLGLKEHSKTLIMNTVNAESTHKSQVVSVKVSSTNDLDAEPMYIKEVWTVNSESFSNVQQNIHTDWKHVKNLNILDVKATEVRLLIGINAPKAHIQTDFREGRENQPIAVCTRLGWSILGTTSRSESDEIQAKVHFIVQRDQQLHQQIEQFWKTESFGVICNDIKATSVEDRILQHILQNSTRLTDGHYEISMLWKTNSDLPCNFRTAEQRFVSLAKRLRTKNLKGCTAQLLTLTLRRVMPRNSLQMKNNRHLNAPGISLITE